MTRKGPLAALLLLVLAARALANGGGVILTPPPDFTEIAPGSVRTILSGVHVRNAVEDAGEVWAATLDRGVAHRKEGDADWAWLTRASGALPADGTTRVARFAGATWVGLAGGGLARVEAKATRAFGPEDGLPRDEVLDLAVAGGRLWVLTAAGLVAWDGARFGPAPAAGDPPRARVTAIATGFDGKLYAGSEQAEVAVLDGASWTRWSFAGRIVGRVVRCVAPGVGHIWFGTFGSLSVFTPATGRLDDETAEKPVLFPSRIMLSLAGTPDLMLVVSGGGGLYRFDRSRLAWHLYSDANGLPSLSIDTVTLNGASALVATAAGLARVDLAAPLPSELRARATAAPSPSAPAPAASAVPSPAGAPPADDGGDAVSRLPPAASALASTGRALLGTPALLAPRPFTCLTCHRNLHGNPGFVLDGSPPGTVDLTSTATAPSSDDGIADPRRIPALFGLRFRGPYPSSGVTPSLREYLRAHVVRDFEAAEPSGAVLDALEAYLSALEPPPAPGLQPDGELAVHPRDPVARGARAFRRPFPQLGGRSCAGCHVPEQHFTDNRLHRRADGRWVVTPSLLATARAAPYFSDGSRRTLRDAVTYYNESYHLLLRQDECDDLAAYLATVGEVTGP